MNDLSFGEYLLLYHQRPLDPREVVALLLAVSLSDECGNEMIVELRLGGQHCLVN